MDPPAAQVLAGGHEHHSPLLNFDLGDECLRIELPASARMTVGGVDPITLDRYGSVLDQGAVFLPALRIGARLDTGRELAPFALFVEYEHDLLSGATGGDPELAGDSYPSAQEIDHELRKAFVRGSLGRYLHLQGGYTTSHWGLGLLANDGAHGWTPGSARFADPRSGDRVLRTMLATGPHDGGVVASLGVDVLDDDLLADDDVLLPGDSALQFVGALMLGRGSKHSAGIYVVARHQEAASGGATDVWVADATFSTSFDVQGATMKLAAEGAVITGTTELAPSTDFPEHDVLQAGAALRASLDGDVIGTVLDLLLASGDQNFDDSDQNAFRADPNYEIGLLLFRHLIAAQSARSAATAGDTALVGVPAKDLNRLPTRGSPTNTVAIFPRVRLRPAAGVELYGGPLFAFSPVPLVDPFNTRIAGGAQRNSLDETPGRYLGTEFDVGARYRLNAAGVELTLGAEGGVLRPGSGLRARDQDEASIFGGRLMLEAKL